MTNPNFDPFEPIWREIRDSFRATVPQIRMAPQIRLLPAFRLLPEIRAMPEIDLLRDVREQFFASYRDAIRELAFEGFSSGRTVWSDQLADLAATLAAARSTVTVAEDVENTGIVDAADDGAADLLAAQVAELKDQVSALAAQVRNLVRMIDASRPQAMPWLYSPPGQTFLMMITIALALASFIGDRVDAAQDQPPVAPPPAVAPPAMLLQDGR